MSLNTDMINPCVLINVARRHVNKSTEDKVLSSGVLPSWRPVTASRH